MKEDVLPEGWEKMTLGELITIERGSSPRPIKSFLTTDDDGVNWVKIGDTSLESKYVTKTAEKINKEGAKKSKAVFAGDLILSNSMSLGRPYIMAIDGYIHDGWFVLRVPETASTDFLYYLLSSSDIQAQFTNLAVGGVVQNIRSELVKQAKFNLPPLPEQQYLSQKLTALLDEVVQTKQRLEAIPALLKQFRQSVLADAVSGRLINNKFIKNNLLKDSVDILNGARKPISSTERKKIQGNIPYYGATGIVDYLNDFTHDGRFLLVGEDGANLLTKAKDLAYIVEGKVWVNNHAHVLKEKPSYCLNFIKIVINSLDLSAWVTGTAQPKLTKKALESLPIPHASLEQQTQIVQKVETYFALADEIETQVKAALENVNLLTQSILAKAFSGELSAAWRNSKVTETQGNV